METENLSSLHAPLPEYIPGLIAVVGCDGTGKSTLTTDLVKNLQKRWVTERRYLGLVSGEDSDKIKRLPLIGTWLERRLAVKSSKTQSMSTRAPALWAALIMYGFSLRRMANDPQQCCRRDITYLARFFIYRVAVSLAENDFACSCSQLIKASIFGHCLPGSVVM